MNTAQTNLPALPLEAWEKSKMTLHLILQIIGKVRLKLTPRKNHWWYITEYLSPRGFTTGTVPFGGGYHAFEITIDVHREAVEIKSSKGDTHVLELKDGLSIGVFYKRFMKALHDMGIEVNILARPYDIGLDKPFAEITEYHHFQWEYIRKFWRIMLWVDGVFKEFSGRFYGKTCPVHLYWHHMDLTVTRFSGREGPPLDPASRISDKDAYTHEVISFGFWAGDENVREPAFYSYTYPSPEGVGEEPLLPKNAIWNDGSGSPMAFYRYEDLRAESDPRAALLDFLESAYQAGAKRAGWDVEGFRTLGLGEL